MKLSTLVALSALTISACTNTEAKTESEETPAAITPAPRVKPDPAPEPKLVAGVLGPFADVGEACAHLKARDGGTHCDVRLEDTKGAIKSTLPREFGATWAGEVRLLIDSPGPVIARVSLALRTEVGVFVLQHIAVTGETVAVLDVSESTAPDLMSTLFEVVTEGRDPETDKGEWLEIATTRCFVDERKRPRCDETQVEYITRPSDAKKAEHLAAVQRLCLGCYDFWDLNPTIETTGQCLAARPLKKKCVGKLSVPGQADCEALMECWSGPLLD